MPKIKGGNFMEAFTFIVLLVTGTLYWVFTVERIRDKVTVFGPKLKMGYYGLFFICSSLVGIFNIKLTTQPITNVIEPYSSILILFGYFALNYILIFQVFKLSVDGLETEDKQFEMFSYKQKNELIIRLVKQIANWKISEQDKGKLAISLFQSFSAMSSKTLIVFGDAPFDDSTEFHGVHYKIVVAELKDIMPFLLDCIKGFNGVV